MHTTISHIPTHGKCSRQLICIFALVMAFTCQPAWAAGSYTYAGDVVTDTGTGLMWKRCSAGQTWDGGTCTNTAGVMTHEQALAYASGQIGWRLPNVKELASIVDDSRINPSIDILAFPNTPSNDYYYWTSTPYAGITSSAWCVRFYRGEVVYCYRGSSVRHVRLVR